MITNVLAYLENTARRVPEKTAVVEEARSCTYAQLLSASRSVGTALARLGAWKKPVGVYMEKGIDALCAFLGILTAGGCYTLMDPSLPAGRLGQVAEVLRAEVIVTGKSLLASARQVFPEKTVVTVEELRASEADEALLSHARARALDTDPVYVNFTSGSTGTPKGIAVAHRSIVDFIDCFTDIFEFRQEDVIANQAPFDFDVSVKDIYSALRTGATLLIVPRRLFSAPVELVDYLSAHGATVLVWAVSALCLMTTFHALDYRTPETIRQVLFSGEVMPLKHLRQWRAHLPQARFVNLYGPTEITCNCTYHILRPEDDYADGIPIGAAFPNEEVFLLDEADAPVEEPGRTGEICVRGTALALGYWGAQEQNAAHFCQDPRNPFYPERIYRTGDLGTFDEEGLLRFCGRKDFQVKHMGHRVELEEIERAMSAVEGVERCCCVFDERRSRLKGFYVGSIDRDALAAQLEKTLPVFMIPGTLRQMEALPLTKNGKIDRKLLLEQSGRSGK